MYKDDPEDIHLSIDGENEYEYDENRLQYKKGKMPNSSISKKGKKKWKKKRKGRGGGDCADWVCKKSVRYRFGYAVAIAVVLTLVFMTPRTTLYLPPRYEQYNTASVTAFGMVLFIMLLSYWMVQNSDPGFLTDIISPDEAVMYSSDAFRAHLMKSEWGDEDDGTWEEGIKNIMLARTKFTDDDLEEAERKAKEVEEKRKERKNNGKKDGEELDAKAVNDAMYDSFNKKDRIVNVEYGEETEIEGLLFVETGVSGKKIKKYRIDTKHPDLPYRAIYCKAERRWVGKLNGAVVVVVVVVVACLCACLFSQLE